MQPNSSTVTRRALGPMLMGISLDMELEPGLTPVPKVEVPLDREFIALLRANLHAAAQHIALGHEGPSFRECDRPACLDAVMLIPPQPEGIEQVATDAELDAILNSLLATLEEGLPAAAGERTRPRGGTSYFAPMPE